MKQSSTLPSHLLLSFIFLFAMGCEQPSKNEGSAKSSDESDMETAQVLNTADIQKQLAVNCYACHNPNSGSHEEIIAPPLAGIKMKYMNSTADRTAFIERMSDFIEHPSQESAMMQGPVKQLGVMPKTALGKSQIQAIVTYLYDNEIPAPVWFADHQKEKQGANPKRSRKKN